MLCGDLNGKEVQKRGIHVYAGVGNGNPIQYSCLENLMDRGAWRAAVHGAAKIQT